MWKMQSIIVSYYVVIVIKNSNIEVRDMNKADLFLSPRLKLLLSKELFSVLYTNKGLKCSRLETQIIAVIFLVCLFLLIKEREREVFVFKRYDQRKGISYVSKFKKKL